MRKEEWHNHNIIIATPGPSSTEHQIMHSHPMPDEKGHTHEGLIGEATTTEEVPA